MFSPFFVRTAKSAVGVAAPVDINVPIVVLAQIVGVTTQAGIVKFVASVMK